MINGAVFLFILGVYVAYKLACWAGEPDHERTTNHEDGSPRWGMEFAVEVVVGDVEVGRRS